MENLLSGEWIGCDLRGDERTKVVLPRPGCGNGRLVWADVKPVLAGLPDEVLIITWR